MVSRACVLGKNETFNEGRVMLGRNTEQNSEAGQGRATAGISLVTEQNLSGPLNFTKMTGKDYYHKFN